MKTLTAKQRTVCEVVVIVITALTLMVDGYLAKTLLNVCVPHSMTLINIAGFHCTLCFGVIFVACYSPVLYVSFLVFRWAYRNLLKLSTQYYIQQNFKDLGL